MDVYEPQVTHLELIWIHKFNISQFRSDFSPNNY